MIDVLLQQVRDAKRRVQMAIGRCVLSAIDDTTLAQTVQLQLLEGEVADTVERFQQYGFTSVPHSGAEGVMVSVGGLRSHGIVVAVEDRRYRLKGLAAGEVAIYDDQGQQVVLKRDQVLISSTNKIVVHSDAEIDFTGPKAVISTAEVDLGGTGGQGVARLGDQVTVGASVGTITSASSTVKATG